MNQMMILQIKLPICDGSKTNIVNKYKPVKKVTSNNYLHTTNISNIYEVILRGIFKTNKQNCLLYNDIQRRKPQT